MTSTTLSPFLQYEANANSNGCRFYDDNRPSRSRNNSYEYGPRQTNARKPSVRPIERHSKRSWPPFPRVEDEATALSHEYQPPPSDVESSEALVRGEIDQLPIILEVNPKSATEPASAAPIKSQTEKSRNSSRSLKSRSSSESLGPHTPDSVDSNPDRRYVYIPEKGIEIPLTYDEPRIEKSKGPTNHSERERGRKDTPKLQTDFSRKSSPVLVPSPIERERSPYAHAPKSIKPKEARFSGEYLPSPGLLSPTIRFPDAGNTISTTRKVDRQSNNAGSQASSSPQYPVRPPMQRYTSATAYSGEPVSAGGPRRRSTHFDVSSDESDDSAEESLRKRHSTRLGPSAADSNRESSVPRFDGTIPQKERESLPENRATSPPLRTLSACDQRAPAPRVQLPPGLGPSAGKISMSSTQFDSRRASPRWSPASTPHSSPAPTPPGTPPSNIYQRKTEFQTAKRNTLPLSRPSSPSQAPQYVKGTSTIAVDVHDIGENRPGLRSRQTSPLPSPAYDGSSPMTQRPRSSQTSPLPSPRSRGSNPHAGPRIDIREPSPASRHRSSSSATDALNRYATRHASLLPFNMPSSPTLRLPEPGQRRRASSNTEIRPNFPSDPVALQKAFESPQAAMKLRPLGPTRAVSVGPAPPATLPPCPRKDFVAGYNDWYTLVGFPSFAICSTCRDAVMIPGYAHNFTPRTPKPHGQKTRCDFGVPWVRMAWLMTRSQNRPDVNLLYAMAEITAHEPPCPGKVEAVREWYKIDDPDTGRHVSNFNVCSYCVRNVETLFPVLRGVFRKARLHHQPAQSRPCDLRTSSQRFSRYVDLLEETANQALQFRRVPNVIRFIDFARRMVANRECPGEDILRGQAWYIIPHLPEFTTCEECYDLIVCPQIDRSSSLAAQFNRKEQIVAPSHVGVSCQLFSPRMRKIFREACENNDFQHLRNFAVQRHRAERNLQTWHAESHRYPEDERADRLEELVEEWRRWE